MITDLTVNILVIYFLLPYSFSITFVTPIISKVLFVRLIIAFAGTSQITPYTAIAQH